MATLGLGLSVSQAATLYIGDDAAEGFNVTAGGGTTADSVTQLTYAFTGAGSTYTVPFSQTIRLSEVNFFADESGNLTPFIARYNGGNNQLASSYTVLAIGDPIAVATGGAFGPVGNILQNRQFTIGGSNPTVAVSAGDVIVAGLFQSARVVLLGPTTGPNVDYINSGNSLPGSAGSILTSDGDFATLNRTLRYNVGFDVVPEPTTGALALLGLGLLGRTRLRNRRVGEK